MRLIDADKLKSIENLDDYSMLAAGIGNIRDVQDIIDDAPSVDAVPAVHGRWEYDADGIPRCSVCHAKPGLDGAEDYALTPHCPTCGADMRGKDKLKHETD
jgi:hypothetical protein